MNIKLVVPARFESLINTDCSSIPDTHEIYYRAASHNIWTVYDYLTWYFNAGLLKIGYNADLFWTCAIVTGNLTRNGIIRHMYQAYRIQGNQNNSLEFKNSFKYIVQTQFGISEALMYKILTNKC